jgi:integrase
MATITKRVRKDRSVRYQVKVRIHGKPTVTKTYINHETAKNEARKLEADVQSGKYFREKEKEAAKQKQKSVEQMLDRYKEEYLPELKSRRVRNQHIEWWKDEIGKMKLDELTTTVLRDCRKSLQSGKTRTGEKRSNSTCNRYMATLSHALTMAADGDKDHEGWGWIEQAQIPRIKALKEPAGRTRFLDQNKELPSLLTACKNSKYDGLHLAVSLALSTGARKGEILGLSWGDIKLDDAYAHVRDSKNGEQRVLPLIPSVVGLLRERKKNMVRDIRSDLVFPGPRDASKPFNIDKYWRAAVTDAGIKDFRFHDLRHSCASYLAMNGASAVELADVLGHKTLEMVKRYSHLNTSHKASVIEKMSGRFLDGIK